MKVHSSYLHGLRCCSAENGYKVAPPPDEDLRAEDLTRPVVGDLMKPGMVVRTSYGSGPYLVESVKAYPYYERFRAWSLVLINFDRERQAFIKHGEQSLCWINELVVEWDGNTPHFRYLFKANDDETFIVQDQAFRVNRAGQLSMF